MEPLRFGRYVLDERLGSGGMAEVFRAHVDDGMFQKQVCIKRILPQLAGTPGFADMLRDEAAIAARLSHTNLVQALDFGAVDGTLFIAMELIEGTSLSHVMKVLRAQGQRFPRSRALHIAVCICRGLHAAHTATANGKPLMLIHRDVSPHNVLLGKDGVVKVGDFGVARAVDRVSKTQTGAIKGKPNYMAPEQAAGDACDHRVDQFATGIVLWEMLAGRPLFPGRALVDVLESVARCEVPSLRAMRDGIDASLDDVVHRALSRDAGARFADMAALERALDKELARLKATLTDIDLRPLVEHALATPSSALATPKPGSPSTDIVKRPGDTDEARDRTQEDMDAPSVRETSSEGVWAKPLLEQRAAFENEPTQKRAVLGQEPPSSSPSSSSSSSSEPQEWAPSTTSVSGLFAPLPPAETSDVQRLSPSPPPIRTAPTPSVAPEPPAANAGPGAPTVPFRVPHDVVVAKLVPAASTSTPGTPRPLSRVTSSSSSSVAAPPLRSVSSRALLALGLFACALSALLLRWVLVGGDDTPPPPPPPPPMTGLVATREEAPTPTPTTTTTPTTTATTTTPTPTTTLVVSANVDFDSAAKPDDVRERPKASSLSPKAKETKERTAAIDEAKRKLLAGDSAGAVADLAPYVKSTDPAVHRTLGVAYAKLKQNALARKHYEKYLELDKDAPDRAQVEAILGGK